MEKEEGSITQNLLANNVLEEGGINPSDSSITPALVLSVLVASCGSLISGCGVGYTSPVGSALMSELYLSKAQFSMFGSLCTAGGLLGSIISGTVTDYLGRRCTMGVTALSCLIGWLAIAFAEVAWSLYFGRFLVGIGMGLISYVVPIYLAEITPKYFRGGAVLTFTLVICCGISLMFFLGLILNWRILALMATVPCIVQIFSLPFIPESPRWLMKVGREKDYEESLQRLRGSNTDISLEAAEIKEYTEAVENTHESNLLALFQKKHAYALIIGLGIMALGQLSGAMGIVLYASQLFESAGFSNTVGIIGMAIIQLPVTGMGVLLMDKLGRRPLLILSASGMCLGCILSGLSFLLKDLGLLANLRPGLVFAGIMLFSASYPMGMGGIPYIIMSEVFPINVKGTAGSLATAVNMSTSWIVCYSFNFMLDWSSSGSFLIFACANAATCLFVVKLVPETKGRTLEEIQESLTHGLH